MSKEELATINGIQINQSDYDRLSDDRYNDIIIDCVLQSILQKHRTKHCNLTNCFAAKKISSMFTAKDEIKREDRYQEFADWNHGEHLSKTRFTIIPCNSKEHWFAVIICNKTKEDDIADWERFDDSDEDAVQELEIGSAKRNGKHLDENVIPDGKRSIDELNNSQTLLQAVFPPSVSHSNASTPSKQLQRNERCVIINGNENNNFNNFNNFNNLNDFNGNERMNINQNHHYQNNQYNQNIQINQQRQYGRIDKQIPRQNQNGMKFNNLFDNSMSIISPSKHSSHSRNINQSKQMNEMKQKQQIISLVDESQKKSYIQDIDDELRTIKCSVEYQSLKTKQKESQISIKPCCHDYQDAPCILLLDSLNLIDEKCELITNLFEFIRWEYKRINQEDLWEKTWGENRIVKRIKVPQQKNGTDCGVYMLYFIKKFMKYTPSSPEMLSETVRYIHPRKERLKIWKELKEKIQSVSNKILLD